MRIIIERFRLRFRLQIHAKETPLAQMNETETLIEWHPKMEKNSYRFGTDKTREPKKQTTTTA